MALSDLTPNSVRAAIAEFDRLGREGFLNAHRFGEARTYFVELNGKLYDARAIAAVAHGYIGPGFIHLKSSHFAGEGTVKRALEALGFTVMKLGDAGSTRPVAHPDWTRDELILALDFYLHQGRPTTEADPAVVELSELLQRLNETLGQSGDAAFRSPAAVYRTIDAYVYLDPTQARRGDAREGQAQRAVWADFHSDPAGLHNIAETIRAVIDLPRDEAPPDYDPDEITEAPEGKLLTRLHRYRERNRALVDQRKRMELRVSGKLACEACGFDFAKTYGARGHGYIEAHHTKPVSTLTEQGKTLVADLALLCANCHRMIHAAQPWLDLSELKALLGTRPLTGAFRRGGRRRKRETWAEVST